MSPKSGGRAQRRQRRNLLISVLVVVAISVGSFAAVFAAKWSPRLGLDLAGGVAVVYTAEGQHVSQADLNETVNILNLRVNGLGVSGAQVQATGKNQISVSIPGVTNAQQVLNQIGQTARMYFRPVLCFAYPQSVPKSQKNKVLPRGIETLPACASSSALTAANLNVTPNNSPQGYSSNNVPPDTQFAVYPSTSVLKPGYAASSVLLPGIGGACDGTAAIRCVLGPAQMTGHSIASATATQNQTGAWVVDYTLAGSAGSALWDKVAQQNFHQLLGIELDGQVYSAPIIQPTQSSFSSFQGRGEISGSLTQADAQNLAQAMNFGALPVTLKAATSETVSATLGHSALVAGLGAGIVGLILVLLYVLLYYRALGLVVISGTRADGDVAVGDHLGARPHLGGAELRPGRHHRADRLHRHHGGLVHRLLRTAEGRGEIGSIDPDIGRSAASRARGGRCGRPTSCRCSRPSSCTWSRSAT